MRALIKNGLKIIDINLHLQQNNHPKNHIKILTNFFLWENNDYTNVDNANKIDYRNNFSQLPGNIAVIIPIGNKSVRFMCWMCPKESII